MHEINHGLTSNPIVALLGPRQCGKTTLAKAVAAGRLARWFDLEDPNDLFQLENNTNSLLHSEGLIIIDEIQRLPALFSRLRVWADREFPRLQFLVTGSASFELVRGVSESLAGRVRFVKLGGLDLQETEPDWHDRLWLRGGFPRSFLASDDEESWMWRRDFIDTFLTRDLPLLHPVRHPAALLRRFWTMLAHYHGMTWNAQQVAASLGLDTGTVNRYLQIMVDAFMVRLLPPWTENVGKRIRKAPKLYLRDAGVAHYLLNIRSEDDLLSNPICGPSWEGFAVEQILRFVPDDGNAYYWSTHGGAEVDLMLDMGSRRYGFEIKRNATPSTTKSMRIAIEDLKLDRLYVVYPGEAVVELDAKIHAVPLGKTPAIISGLVG
jgi:predicted AAA+ superfamily ATPase